MGIFDVNKSTQEQIQKLLDGSASATTLAEALPDYSKFLTGVSGYYGTTGATQAFQDLLKQINAPSSVEAVQKQIEQTAGESKIADILKESKKTLGSSAIDLFERGLALPGAGSSSIAGATQANILNAYNKQAGDVRTQLALKELERLASKESQLTDVYKTKYSTEAQSDLVGKQLTASTAQNLYNQYANLVGQQAGITANKQGAFADILANLLKTDWTGSVTPGKDSNSMNSKDWAKIWSKIVPDVNLNLGPS